MVPQPAKLIIVLSFILLYESLELYFSYITLSFYINGDANEVLNFNGQPSNIRILRQINPLEEKNPEEATAIPEYLNIGCSYHHDETTNKNEVTRLSTSYLMNTTYTQVDERLILPTS